MIMITKQIKNTDDDTEKIYSGFVLLTNQPLVFYWWVTMTSDEGTTKIND